MRLVVGVNDLASNYPELIKEWSTNNERKPDEVVKSSNIPVKCVCKSCGYEYQARIQEKINGYICPVCDDKTTVEGYNDLKTTHPELAKEYSKNNERDITTVRKNIDVPFLWTCPKCNGEYLYSVNEREAGDDSCPYCANRRVLTGFNDLATKYPELVESYLDENDVPASEVLYTSKKKYKWSCPKCKGKYKTIINDKRTDNCPYCNDLKFLSGVNDLKTKYPELAKSFSKNNPFTAEEVFYKSYDYFKWNCPTCGGEYYASINGRQENRCPYCENRKVLPGFNDIETLYPDIAKSFSKANGYPASQVLYSSNFEHYWDCDVCGGTYKATFDERVNEKCPYCENKKVLPGFNDLSTTHPHIAKEWGIENYLLHIGGPENYKFDSTKQVYWKCPNCNTRYKMAIDDRVICDKRHHESCWKCSGRMKNILKL